MTLTLIVLFSALFAATHLVLSYGSIREGFVNTIGQWPFRGLYSLISFLTLGPAAVLWWQNRHLGAVLWELPPVVAEPPSGGGSLGIAVLAGAHHRRPTGALWIFPLLSVAGDTESGQHDAGQE